MTWVKDDILLDLLGVPSTDEKFCNQFVKAVSEPE